MPLQVRDAAHRASDLLYELAALSDDIASGECDATVAIELIADRAIIYADELDRWARVHRPGP